MNCGPMVEEKQHKRKNNSHEEEAKRFRGKSFLSRKGKNPGHK